MTLKRIATGIMISVGALYAAVLVAAALYALSGGMPS